MSVEEMENLLIELQDTNYWQAIKKYTDHRIALTIASLATLDAFKQPNDVSKAQGCRNGLMDIGQFINMTKDNRKKAEKAEEKKVS